MKTIQKFLNGALRASVTSAGALVSHKFSTYYLIMVLDLIIDLVTFSVLGSLLEGIDHDLCYLPYLINLVFTITRVINFGIRTGRISIYEFYDAGGRVSTVAALYNKLVNRNRLFNLIRVVNACKGYFVESTDLKHQYGNIHGTAVFQSGLTVEVEYKTLSTNMMVTYTDKSGEVHTVAAKVVKIDNQSRLVTSDFLVLE